MGERRAQQHRFVILGEPASKANSRKLVLIGGKPRFIKSKKALDWLKQADKQVRRLPVLLSGPLVIYCRIFYASQRPDLDPSLIFDFLQERVYENDRQLREQHLYHAIDRENPRTEIVIEAFEPCLI